MANKELLKRISKTATAMLAAAAVVGGVQSFGVSAKTAAEMGGAQLGAFTLTENDVIYGDSYELKLPGALYTEGVSDTDTVRTLVQVSKTADFNEKDIVAETTVSSKRSAEELKRNGLEVSMSNLESGQTYYVRAVAYSENSDENATVVYDKYTGEYNYRVYGPESTMTFTAKGADVAYASTEVTNKSITVNAYVDGKVTGIQVYRATENGKYKKIATVADTTYTDKGLQKNTAYQYKVRTYTKDQNTGKVTYGAFKGISSQTWNKSIDVEVKNVTKNTVKLKWNKVAGVDGYEVLKKTGTSTDSTVSDRYKDDSFSTYTLVKDIKKAKKTTFVDKKLKADQEYDYVVRAYKEVNGSKVYVSDGVNVDLSFGSLNVTSDVTKADGSRTVKWDKVVGATKYVIEKSTPADTDGDGAYDAFVWQPVSESTATSATFTPDATVTVNKSEYTSTTYRVVPYKGDVVGAPTTFSVTNVGATVVTGVKATANADGSVSLSWDPVANAAYYEVYRVASTDNTYNKETGVYSPSVAGERLSNYYDVNAYNALNDNDKAVLGTLYPQQIGKAFEYTTTYAYKDATGQTTTSDSTYKGHDKVRAYYETSRILGTTFTDKAYTATGAAYTGVTDTYDSTTSTDSYAYTGTSAVSEQVYEGPKAGTTYTYYVKAYTVKDSTDSNGQTSQFTYCKYKVDANGVVTHEDDITSAVNVKSTDRQSLGYGKPATVQTKTVATQAKKVKIKAVKSPKASQATITWKKVKGATGYVVYRADKKKGTYTVVSEVGAKKAAYVDKKLATGKYFYKVAAVTTNEAGADVVGKLSKPVNVTVK